MAIAVGDAWYLAYKVPGAVRWHTRRIFGVSRRYPTHVAALTPDNDFYVEHLEDPEYISQYRVGVDDELPAGIIDAATIRFRGNTPLAMVDQLLAEGPRLSDIDDEVYSRDHPAPQRRSPSSQRTIG